MKKIVKLNEIDPILFAGVNDNNIKIIESELDVKIVLRGNELYLNETKIKLKKIELLVNDIIYTINRKGFIDDDDIKTLLNSSEKDNKRWS